MQQTELSERALAALEPHGIESDEQKSSATGEPVTIAGVEYATVIDDSGTRRFPEVPGLWSRVRQRTHEMTPEVAELAKTNAAVAWVVAHPRCTLTDIRIAYQKDGTPFSQRDYAEFYMGIGYSVVGWADLSMFSDMYMGVETERRKALLLKAKVLGLALMGRADVKAAIEADEVTDEELAEAICAAMGVSR